MRVFPLQTFGVAKMIMEKNTEDLCFVCLFNNYTRQYNTRDTSNTSICLNQQKTAIYTTIQVTHTWCSHKKCQT